MPGMDGQEEGYYLVAKGKETVTFSSDDDMAGWTEVLARLEEFGDQTRKWHKWLRWMAVGLCLLLTVLGLI